MTEFFAMGGYGHYVWAAYATFFVVLLIDAFMPLLRKRSIIHTLQRRYQREFSRRNSS